MAEIFNVVVCGYEGIETVFTSMELEDAVNLVRKLKEGAPYPAKRTHSDREYKKATKRAEELSASLGLDKGELWVFQPDQVCLFGGDKLVAGCACEKLPKELQNENRWYM